MDKNYLRLRNSFNESELHLKDLSICGAYSIDSECNYHSDFSELKYLYPAYLKTQTLDHPFDLNQDYDKIVPKLKEGSACLGNISKWLREHPEKAQTVVRFDHLSLSIFPHFSTRCFNTTSTCLILIWTYFFFYCKNVYLPTNV